jgi:DDE superfamily endonuclease
VEVEELQPEIGSKLEQLEVPAERPVHVWVEDEHRAGGLSIVRRGWPGPGPRPPAPSQAKYQGGYVDGAAEGVTGETEFLYAPPVSFTWTNEFWEPWSATDPKAIHLVMWDRAGCHPKAARSQLDDARRVLPLPAYSPEFNPRESLWDQVKRRIAHETWETLETREAAISEALEPLWTQVAAVRSLLGDTWLTRSIATFWERRKSLISH